MRIVLISHFWPGIQKSGVAMATRAHINILMQAGHHVEIIGDTSGSLVENIPQHFQHSVFASGSGSLYSPVRVDRDAFKRTIQLTIPDLVIVEGWQTAITDSAIDIASNMGLPILMVSHGISLHSFKHSIFESLRSISWFPYRYFSLPPKISKLSAITCLSELSESPRFYDRVIANSMGVPIVLLSNTPANYIEGFKVIPRSGRKNNLLIIGYFSRIKNQLAALKLLRFLPKEISITLIGEKQGYYYQECRNFVDIHGLGDRVNFMDDQECVVSEHISTCIAMISTSITEVLPIVLIEAMAAGTPFIAPPVGAIPELFGGIICSDLRDQVCAILRLINDERIWSLYSEDGVKQYRREFHYDLISIQLQTAIDVAMKAHKS